MMRSSRFLTAFIVLLFIGGCKKSPARLYVVTYFRAGVQDAEDGRLLHFSGPQLKPSVFQFELPGPGAVKFDVGEKILNYEAAQPGVYLANLSPDTLVSIPVYYGDDPQQVARPDTAARRQRGETNTLLVTPTDMTRISADAAARLFIYQKPPDVKEESSEFYQVRSTKELRN
jgi:hypothetical protein